MAKSVQRILIRDDSFGTETVRDVRVRLNELECALARAMGRARRAANRNNNVPDGQISTVDPETMDILAAGAEIAVCRALNIYPDLSLANGHAARPVHDGVWGVGTIDVKHTQWQNGGLAAVAGKNGKRTDYYVLVTGSLPEYVLVGWCYAEDLFDESNLRLDWKRPGYYIGAKHLRPFGIHNVQLP